MSATFSPIIEGFPSTVNGYSIFTETSTNMVDQRNALINDDWSTLEELANKGLGIAYGRYREIRRSTLGKDLSANADSFAKNLIQHAGDEDTRKAFFDKVKEELLNIDPNVDPNLLEGLDEMSVGNTNNTPINTLLEGTDFNATDETMITDTIEGVVGLATKSLMALAYANFHQHNEFISETQSVAAHGDEFLDLLIEPVDSFEGDLSAHLKGLYSDLVTDKGVSQGAEKIMQFLEENLPEYCRTQAVIRQYAIALKDAGRGTASEKVGALAVRAGDVTREAFAAYSSAYYLSLQSTVGTGSKKARSILKKSNSYSFDKSFPNGKNVSIAKVDDLNDGDYVEVIGQVKSIETGRDSDDKLVTQVTLYDPSSKTEMTAAAVYVHFRHIGLLEGSYARVSGTWKSGSVINHNNPALEIEKLSVNELSKASWRIAFLDLSDKFVDRWPGGFNIQFGVAPHISTPEGDDSESEILGAGELIFKPFRR